MALPKKKVSDSLTEQVYLVRTPSINGYGRLFGGTLMPSIDEMAINRAYFVMVAIDHDGKPQPVPGLIIETESEKYEWQSGEKRYQLRKQRHKEGY